MPILQEQEPLPLATRLKNPIANSIDRREPWDGLRLAVEDFKRQYPSAEHRPVGPSVIYNCHGLTFAARRTNISDPQQILNILRDDSYTKITQAEVLGGDIVIYLQDGDVAHSGIVVRSAAAVGGLLSAIYVLSKWGHAHEVIHGLWDSPYKPATIEFYRINR